MRSIDVNPLIVANGVPIAVDALIEVEAWARRRTSRAIARCSSPRASSSRERRAIPASSASSRRTTSSRGYTGKVFLTNRGAARSSTNRRSRSVDELPDGAADLVFVCTPSAAIPDLLRSCARKGVTAAFVSSAGFGEAGEDCAPSASWRRCATSWASCLRARTGGASSRRRSASARRSSRPYPPAGRIAVASQSGGFVQAFPNYARSTGVGVSRAVSANNSAATSVADHLEYFASDPPRT